MQEFFSNWIADPNFWVMVSSILCFGFIGLKAAKPLAAALDNRAVMINSRLEEATALRNEAAALLADYQAKANAAIAEAESIMQNAQRRAEQMRLDMAAELHTAIARHEQNAKNRILRLEEETMQIVKTAIITQALDKVQAQVANDTAATASIDHAMTDLKKILQK